MIYVYFNYFDEMIILMERCQVQELDFDFKVISYNFSCYVYRNYLKLKLFPI